jgi:hypothetical protein
MSAQIIPLKSRTDSRDRTEFWPQRLFAFELRRGNPQLGLMHIGGSQILQEAAASGRSPSATEWVECSGLADEWGYAYRAWMAQHGQEA